MTTTTQPTKTVIYYDEMTHLMNSSSANDIAKALNDAVAEIEAITESKVMDKEAFRSDILGESMKLIKKSFAKVFALGLNDKQTLKTLSIDMTNIERLHNIVSTNPTALLFDAEGKAYPSNDKEPYLYYAETKEEIERLDFANHIITVLNKCNRLTPHLSVAGLGSGLRVFVVMDNGVLTPNWRFIKE
jgi:hypothetical protein